MITIEDLHELLAEEWPATKKEKRFNAAVELIIAGWTERRGVDGLPADNNDIGFLKRACYLLISYCLEHDHDAVTRDFIAPYARNPAAFDVMTTSLASVGPGLLATVQPHLQDRAVTFVGFGDREEGPPRITAFCSDGAPAAMPPGDERAGGFEIVLVEFLSSLVSSAYDVDLQTAEQLPRIKELLRHMLW